MNILISLTVIFYAQAFLIPNWVTLFCRTLMVADRLFEWDNCSVCFYSIFHYMLFSVTWEEWKDIHFIFSSFSKAWAWLGKHVLILVKHLQQVICGQTEPMSTVQGFGLNHNFWWSMWSYKNYVMRVTKECDLRFIMPYDYHSYHASYGRF